MSDWGKIVSDFTQSRRAMILAIFVAIVAFAPIDAFESFRLQHEVVLKLVGAFAVASILGNLLFWFRDMVMQYVSAKAEEAKVQRKRTEAEEKLWRRFVALNPRMQMFIIELYFSGDMSARVKLHDPMIVTLKQQGFLVTPRNGWKSLDDLGNLIVTVMLSKRMTEFMDKYSEEFQKQADRIKDSGKI